MKSSEHCPIFEMVLKILWANAFNLSPISWEVWDLQIEPNCNIRGWVNAASCLGGSLLKSTVKITLSFKIYAYLVNVLSIIFICILLYIGFLNISLQNKTRKIDKLNNEILSLQSSNLLLTRDINFKERQLYITETFTNSDNAVENIKNKKLSDDNINALNVIIKDYYKTLEF